MRNRNKEIFRHMFLARTKLANLLVDPMIGESYQDNLEDGNEQVVTERPLNVLDINELNHMLLETIGRPTKNAKPLYEKFYELIEEDEERFKQRPFGKFIASRSVQLLFQHAIPFLRKLKEISNELESS